MNHVSKEGLRYEYVCPKCFNLPENCTCKDMPSYLMWIDRNVQEHIRILQGKGYKTTGCCESHASYTNMYISFAFDYGIGDVLPLPRDFRKSGRSVSFMCERGVSDEEYKEQKKKHLGYLLDWCKSLPVAER